MKGAHAASGFFTRILQEKKKNYPNVTTEKVFYPTVQLGCGWVAWVVSLQPNCTFLCVFFLCKIAGWVGFVLTQISFYLFINIKKDNGINI